MTVGLGVLIAGAVSVLVLATVGPVLRRLSVVDVPSARSSHHVPTLRGGGIGPAAGVLAALGTAAALAADGTTSAVLWVFVTGVAGFAALGWLEDLRGISVLGRAAGQLALGVASSCALAAVLRPALWLVVLAGLGIAVLVNATNFMDGINGISALFGVAAGVSYALLGPAYEVPALLSAGLVVAVAFAAFLPWNLWRTRMFLGDVGSYALGASVALLAVWAAFSGVPLLAVTAPVWIYLVDTGWTFCRRVRAGEVWHQPHRSHVYQRLVDAGLTHGTVAAFVATASVACAGLGRTALSGSPLVAGMSFVGLTLLPVLYLASPALAGRLRTSRPAPAVVRLPDDERLASAR